MLDLERARALVQEVIEEQGADFKYTNNANNGDCFYVSTRVMKEWVEAGIIDREWEGVSDLYAADYNPSEDPRYNTGCLIGRVLDKVGEDRQKTPKWVNCNVSQLVNEFSDMMTDEARVYLGNIQYHQDDGKAWGEALAIAEGLLVKGAFKTMKEIVGDN